MDIPVFKSKVSTVTCSMSIAHKLCCFIVLLKTCLHDVHIYCVLEYKSNLCVHVYRETTCKAKHFEVGHAFIGYQKDTPAAVIFQASNQLKKLVASEGGDSTPAWERLQTIGVLKDITTKDLSEADESSDSWKDAVSIPLKPGQLFNVLSEHKIETLL